MDFMYFQPNCIQETPNQSPIFDAIIIYAWNQYLPPHYQVFCKQKEMCIFAIPSQNILLFSLNLQVNIFKKKIVFLFF